MSMQIDVITAESNDGLSEKITQSMNEAGKEGLSFVDVKFQCAANERGVYYSALMIYTKIPGLSLRPGPRP